MTEKRDLLHESRIDYARERFVRNPTRERYQEFIELIRDRSTEQVARMDSLITQSNQTIGQQSADCARANSACSGMPDPFNGGARGGK
jgi:hypothetical protein